MRIALFILMLVPQMALSSGSTGGSGGSAGTSGGGGSAVGNASGAQADPSGQLKVRQARQELLERIRLRQAKKMEEEKDAKLLSRYKKRGKAFDHAHKGLTRVLKSSVSYVRGGRASEVDYENIDLRRLKRYTKKSLAIPRAVVDSWGRNQRLAYYINLYNALTLERVAEKGPVDSIKELGSGFPLFRSPWKVPFFKLFGEDSHLDRIEHELVRGAEDFDEPRIHFAFNCASIGCPALLREPFVAEKLDEQLEKATISFLRDRTRNRYNPKTKSLEVSSIFKWYRQDFEKGHIGVNSLKDFFAKYARYLSKNKKTRALIKSKKIDLDFLPYDWKLNKKKNSKLSRR